MKRNELITFLKGIDLDKVEDFEEEFKYIKFQVNKFLSDPVIYEVYKFIEVYVKKFKSWEDVSEAMLEAIRKRDSKTLHKLTKEVEDFTADYYSFDINGYLVNINEMDILYVIDSLVFYLEGIPEPKWGKAEEEEETEKEE